MSAIEPGRLSNLWRKLAWPLSDLRRRKADPLLTEIVRRDPVQAIKLSGIDLPMWACPSPMDRMDSTTREHMLDLINTDKGTFLTELTQEVHDDITLFRETYLNEDQEPPEHTGGGEEKRAQQYKQALAKFESAERARMKWFDYAVPFRSRKGHVFELRRSQLGEPLYYPHRTEEFVLWAAEELVLGRARAAQLQAQRGMLVFALLCAAGMIWIRW